MHFSLVQRNQKKLNWPELIQSTNTGSTYSPVICTQSGGETEREGHEGDNRLSTLFISSLIIE